MAARPDPGGERQKVVIAGGGVAGAEAALALRDLGRGRIDLHLYDGSGEFVFRPLAVGEPFGAARALRYDLRRLSAHCGASFHLAWVAAVDPQRKHVVTAEGERVPYDQLIVVPGARMLEAVPGAVTFRGAPEGDAANDVIAELRDGRLRRIVFTVPEGRGWSLPLYELALLGLTERGQPAGGGETRITIVTPEDLPLEVFGRRAGEQVSALLAERGVELITGAVPIEFGGGRLRIASGEDVIADAAIALPRLEGRRIEGIPHDDHGFIPIDEQSRVIGLDDVYAAGDATAFPVKQGGIAAQQADAAAEAIAAAAGAELDPRPFDPVLRGILWTGEGARYLYGRPGARGEEESGLGEQPRGGLHNSKVVARYLTPFIDSAAAEADPS
jgi:sulfide:quinone oxidoreductase